MKLHPLLKRSAAVWNTRCRSIVVVLLLTGSGAAAAQEVEPFSHEMFDEVLTSFVDGAGRVDYRRLKAESGRLDVYVAALGKTSPLSHPGRFPTRADSLAYWINAYNAFVLNGVIDAYPVASVKDIKYFSGFFNRAPFRSGGRMFTLNEIEHGILREHFREPRIHAAINCASAGCPRLLPFAFDPADLDAQLDLAMTGFVGEGRNVRIDRGSTTIYLSSIFDWFETDFTDWVKRVDEIDDPVITDYLFHYLEEDDVSYLREHGDVRVKHLDYDWSLNDQMPERP